MNQIANNNPLVSICMPVYNGEKYLREALDSLLGQTYGNFELIISDNASTDGTQEICEEYARRDKRIRYIRQKETIGAAENFNAARAMARGKYFLWAAHDDKWDRTFIEKCVALLERDPELAMAFTAFIGFGDKGEIVKYDPRKYLPSERQLYRRLKQYLLFYNDCKANIIYGVWRQAKVANNILEKLYWGSDTNFVFRGLAAGPFGFVDEVLFFKRMGSAHFEPPKKRNLLVRIIRSLFLVRVPMLLSKLYIPRFAFIAGIRELSFWQRCKLCIFNLWVMLRLFLVRKM